MEILLTDYGLHSRSLRLNRRQEPHAITNKETSLELPGFYDTSIPPKFIFEAFPLHLQSSAKTLHPTYVVLRTRDTCSVRLSPSPDTAFAARWANHQGDCAGC
jgi:hypothetical protein